MSSLKGNNHLCPRKENDSSKQESNQSGFRPEWKFWWVKFVYVRVLNSNVLRRNPPDVTVTSRQKPSTKIIYILLQTSVGLC